MTGGVNSNQQLILEVTLRGPLGQELRLDAVIDTGFSGSLVLPDSVIAQLGLSSHGQAQGMMVDGSIVQYPRYRVEVLWFDQYELSDADGIGTAVLIGMNLLMEHQLLIECRVGGSIEIAQLP